MNKSDQSWIEGFFAGRESERDWKLKIIVFIENLKLKLSNSSESNA